MTIARTGRNHWMLATGLGFGLLRLVKGDCKRVQGRLFQKLTWNASVGWIAAIIIGGAQRGWQSNS